MNKLVLIMLLCMSSLISASLQVDLDFLLHDHDTVWKFEKSVEVEDGQTYEFCSEEYQLKMTVRCCGGENRVKGIFQLIKNGQILSNPCIEGTLGQTMGIELNEDKKASNMLAILFAARKK